MNTPLGRSSSRRGLLRWAALGVAVLAPACAAASPVHEIVMHRDPGCGCCLAWMAHIEQTGRFQTSTRDERDMPAVKQRLRVPSDLVSCHTAEVAGFVIEGHVPAEDVLRLLRDRPHGVIGLAVPGMPLGSPGMEQDGGDARQAFDVLAFRSDGARESFARYDARA